MKKTRVLLADDDQDCLLILQGLLESEYDIVGTVPNGVALLTAALEYRPDLIISDIDMPGLNGIDAVRRLREWLPETKTIFLTGHWEPEYREKAQAVGAVGYLVKGESWDLRSSLHEVIAPMQRTKDFRRSKPPTTSANQRSRERL